MLYLFKMLPGEVLATSKREKVSFNVIQYLWCDQPNRKCFISLSLLHFMSSILYTIHFLISNLDISLIG